MSKLKAIEMAFNLGPVVRKMDSTIHWIVIFHLSQKGIKGNDTRNIKPTKDESDFNSKMLNFIMGFKF